MVRRILLLAAIGALGVPLSLPQIAGADPPEAKSRVGAFEQDLGNCARRSSHDLPAKCLVSMPRSGEIASAYLVAVRGGDDLLRLPSSASWGRSDTLADHFHRHGGAFGARTADDYARQSSEFLQRSQRAGLPTKVDANGVIRVYDPSANTFGSYNPSGTARTFFKPDPSIHGYKSNLDYWNAQPGGAIP